MITPKCPRCAGTIPSEDVNVAKDVAYCRRCNLAERLSVLTGSDEALPIVDVNRPPPGAWYRAEGTELIIGATHRSLGGAVATLLIALFWNGIVSLFVALALAGTLQHLGIDRPRWFPTPIMNGSPMGVGMLIFLWLFLTPFIVIGLAMVFAFLSALGGRTEVRIQVQQGSLFSGIGPLGRRKQFDAAAVQDVRIDRKEWRDNDGGRHRKTALVIQPKAGKELRFGSMLTAERGRFLASALRQALIR